MSVHVRYSKIEHSHSAQHALPENDSTSFKPVAPSATIVHWRGLTVMCLSLCLGIILATSHHYFYSQWDGVDIRDAWSQIWISRTGTALAFTTKLFLAIASSVAYIQQQWLIMHERAFSLQHTDALFGILGDATLFWNVRVWARHPLLSIPALVTWLVPIAAVITPGSLSVVNNAENFTEQVQVPQLSFNKSDYVYSSVGGQAGYIGAHESIQRLSMSTALAGVLPQLPYPHSYSNASYELTYFTPAVRCSDASDILVDNFTAFNMNQSYGGYAYFSYVPGDINWSALRTGDPAFCSPTEWATWDYLSMDAATIYIVTRDLKAQDSNDYYVKCELWNTTQTVNFNFAYPSQVVTLKQPMQYRNNVSLNEYSGGLETASGHAYLAAMDMFGKVLAGGITIDHYTGNLEVQQTSSQLIKIDWSTMDTAIYGLEELFRNMTLSYMTDNSLILNSTQAKYVDVIVSTRPSKYTYAWKDLVLVYGISITCATICVLIGLRAIIKNQATYSNHYSSIVRSLKGSQLEVYLSVADRGQDPLPERLKKVNVVL